MPHRQMMTARHLTDRTESCIRECLADAERSSHPNRKQMYQDFANGAFVLWNRLMKDLADPADPLATAEFEADQARLNALIGDAPPPREAAPSGN
ncbi:hypothetical protein ACVCIC_01375 [Burkholderia glumae]|uniref:hypothetical protein n=1 Tax=Burkholderia glumae TaxID=337 RepID=UPI002036BCEE|nr:hypothetical protein [Burkholderia glumae]MCM2485624.1 hypothetical protein [Burkholderia glumae]MCM2511508.1 hypothetical protein [Burkholderia glumae]